MAVMPGVMSEVLALQHSGTHLTGRSTFTIENAVSGWGAGPGAPLPRQELSQLRLSALGGPGTSVRPSHERVTAGREWASPPFLACRSAQHAAQRKGVSGVPLP